MFVAVAVGFQANSTTISVSEDDGLVTFTLDISGPVDPASVTTVYLTVSGGTAGRACMYMIIYNLMMIQFLITYMAILYVQLENLVTIKCGIEAHKLNLTILNLTPVNYVAIVQKLLQ